MGARNKSECTEEEWALRLKAHREAVAARKQNETPEQRERRLALKREQERRRRLRNPDHVRNLKRQSTKKHAEKNRARVRAWAKANPERHKLGKQKWDKENLPLICKRQKDKRAEHPERFAAIKKKYYQSKGREIQKRYYAENLNARISQRLRSQVLKKLKAARTTKSSPTFALVGCSIAEFKAHIESKFQDGMSWADRASFELDHIIPCAAFDLTDEAQQRACFHFTNMQPLPPQENRRKGTVYNGVRYSRSRESSFLDVR